MDMKPWMDGVLEARGMTRADLARMLGVPPTALARLYSGRAGRQSLRRFADAALASGALALTDAEREGLQDQLSRDPEEESRFTLYAALDSIFLRPPAPQADAAGFEELFEGCAGAARVRVVLYNCTTVPALFRCMARLCAAIPDDRLEITHYIALPDDPLKVTRCLEAILPLLHEGRYAPWACRPAAGLDGGEGLLGADVLLVERTEEDGSVAMESCVFYGGQPAARLRTPCPLPDAAPPPEHVTARLNMPPDLSGDIGLGAYLRAVLRLEDNHAVFQYKPFPGMEAVPPDILLSAARDSLDALPESISRPIRRSAERYTQLIETRYQHRLAETKPQLHVFKRSAFERFLRTGLRDDHLQGCRPYTPEERLAILKAILRMAEQNPHYHLFFMRREDRWRDGEITLYGRLALSIIPPETGWDLGGSHREAMLTGLPAFFGVFGAFFRDRVAAECLTEAQSAAELRRILAEFEA